MRKLKTSDTDIIAFIESDRPTGSMAQDAKVFGYTHPGYRERLKVLISKKELSISAVRKTYKFFGHKRGKNVSDQKIVEFINSEEPNGNLTQDSKRLGYKCAVSYIGRFE